MNVEDDLILIRRYVAQREEGAFGALVRHHVPMVYSAALRSTDGRSDLAADVAQETFIRLAREARRLETHPALVGWLYTTTRNLAATAMRSERARKRREIAHGTDTLLYVEGAAPEWHAVRPQLEELIEKLDERSRDAVVRRFFSGQRFAEIGAALSVSEDAARIKVDRALERLREMLAHRKVHCTAAALTGLLAGLPAAGALPAGLAATVTTAGLTAVKVPGPAASLLQSGGNLKLAGCAIGLAALLSFSGGFLQRRASAREAEMARLVSSDRSSPSEGARDEVLSSSTGSEASGTRGVARAAPFVPVPMGADQFRAVLARQRAMSADTLRNTTLIDGRLRVRLRFHPVYAALALTPAQVERFETVAAEQHLTFTPLIGLPEDSAKHRLSYVARTEKVVRQALGEDYVPAFHAFVSTSDLRIIVGELAADTYYTETPLTSTQGEQLVQACVDLRAADSALAYIDPDTVDWKAVLDRAEAFLSPAQLRALRAALAKRAFDLEFKRITGLPLRRPVRDL